MLIAVHIHDPIHSDAYRRAGEALKAISDLAEALVMIRAISDSQHE